MPVAKLKNRLRNDFQYRNFADQLRNIEQDSRRAEQELNMARGQLNSTQVNQPSISVWRAAALIVDAKKVISGLHKLSFSDVSRAFLLPGGPSQDSGTAVAKRAPMKILVCQIH